MLLLAGFAGLSILLGFVVGQESTTSPFLDRVINCGSWTPVNIPKGYQGTFTSPGYPGPYGRGTECAFVLTTSTDARLQLNCSPVSIPCTGDTFTISPSGDIYFKDATSGLCGYGTIGLNSTSNGLAIYFRSSSTSGGGSFRCVAQSVAKIDPPSSCGCGIRGSNRVVGGTLAGVNEFPWQALLGDISSTGDGKQFCGATLIAPTWVLTAAHCTYGRLAANIGVVVGQANTVTLGPTAQVRRGVKIIQHPMFNRTNVDNDIALIQVDQPFTYTTAVRPACLPFKYASADFSGQIGTVTGWGTTSFGGAESTNLQKVSLPILTTSQCKQNANIGVKITNNMFCTYAAGKDACQGDSGGPLSWADPSSGRVHLVGIISWGTGCARPNFPGVYAKVTNYLNWIQQNTGNAFCSP